MSGAVYDSRLYVFTDVNRFFNAAINLGETVISGQINVDDTVYYIIAPIKHGLVIPLSSDFTFLEEIPFTIANYSDLTWTNGILNDNPSVISFYDNAFTSIYLKDAAYIIYDGEEIEIISKDYSDEGWVMVTLNIPDARELIGKELHTK